MEIRPTIDALEKSLKTLAPLFRRTTTMADVLVVVGHNVRASHLLDPGQWDRTKKEHIVAPGFWLDDERPVHLTYEFHFLEYTGQGNRSFDLNVLIFWTLGADKFRRKIYVDGGEPVPRVSGLYSDLGTRSSDIDRISANVLRAAFMRIERRSGG